MKTILTFLVSVVVKLVQSLLERLERDARLKADAAAETVADTQAIVKETADARSQIRDSDSIDDLVKRMRDEAGRNP